MKIRIFGDIASGKSTLANKLGNKFDIPVFSTDDFVFAKNYSKKRNFKKRKELVKKAVNQKNWIIEGVHHSKWVDSAAKKADLIIVLKVPLLVLIYRIIIRSFKQQNRFNLKTMFKLIFMLIRDFRGDFLKYKKIALKKKHIIAREVSLQSVEKILKNKKHKN